MNPDVGGSWANIQHWARLVRRDAIALYLAAWDPRVPWHAKAVAVCVAAYALSPIDLIPDFVPFLGYVDDLLILPLGIMLAVNLVPSELMSDFRETASSLRGRPPIGRWGAAFVVGLWVLGVIVAVRWVQQFW